MATFNKLVLLTSNYDETVIICKISFAQIISRSLKTGPTHKPSSISQPVTPQGLSYYLHTPYTLQKDWRAGRDSQEMDRYVTHTHITQHVQMEITCYCPHSTVAETEALKF